jgi:hypothetical protein
MPLKFKKQVDIKFNKASRREIIWYEINVVPRNAIAQRRFGYCT